MRNAPPPVHPGLVCPDILAGVSHGSHICAFYETQDDLIDLVLPFLAAGYGREELCVWVTPDSISADEVRSRAREVDIEPGIEIHRARDIYHQEGRFRCEQAISFWDQTAQRARALDRSGTRGSGDTCWLLPNDWHSFLEYEVYVNSSIANKPVALLCTFPISLSKIGDAFDVARAHDFAIAKRGDAWEVVAAPAVAPDRRSELVEAAARVALLTGRERQVLDAIIDGRPNKVIASDLALDVRTIEAHRARLMRRLGVRTIVEAVRLGTLATLATQTRHCATRLPGLARSGSSTKRFA
jgi:DNA-binding CsgD family transcriptional regulator